MKKNTKKNECCQGGNQREAKKGIESQFFANQLGKVPTRYLTSLVPKTAKRSH